MRSKILRNFSALFFSFYATSAISNPPHWHYDEQSTWWAIEDTSQSIPLLYPYAECGVGKHQSPVDLATAKLNNTKPLNRLAALYDADTPTFYNNGHSIQVNTSIDYSGGLKIGEESIPLIQYHLHEPSEHVINGQHFPAELHFVHINEDGRLAVLAVAIEIGNDNPAFQTILDNTPVLEGEQNTNSGIQFNPAALLPQQDHDNLDYFTLAGSLTTPPCSEGVQWYLLSDTITISTTQLEQLKSFYTNNARSAQNLNGRSILSNK
jgi:carbonic anhydrase